MNHGHHENRRPFHSLLFGPRSRPVEDEGAEKAAESEVIE